MILGILIGAPILFIAWAGNPLPTVDQLYAVITLRPDYGNVFVLTKVLPLGAWIAWLCFAWPLLLEVFAGIAGRETAKRVPVFRSQQKFFAVLVASVVLMFAGAGSPALALADSSSDTGAGQMTISQTVTGSAVQQSPAQPQAPPTAVSTAAPVAESAAESYVVQEGDTLWGIAENQLGAGDRYAEIFNASQQEQADGGRLTDPDLIYPGWTVEIPNDDASMATPVPEPAPVVDQAPVVDEAPAVTAPPSTTAAQPEAVPTTAPTAAAPAATTTPEAPTPTPSSTEAAQQHVTNPVAETADDGIDESIPISTIGGIAGVLAAGILSALGVRRLSQRRRRASGERIAMPDPETADLELELRLVEDPIAVQDIDNALRSLQIWAEDTNSELPELLAVRVVNEEAAFYLASPAELPAPFESTHEDNTAWVVRPGRAIEPTREAVSPYPGLVTIGTDPGGGALLLDLEQLGSINLVGNSDIAVGMLNAIAAELATNPWTDQTQVTLVGMPDGLAGELGRFQIHHVDDVDALIRNLSADLRDRRAALDSYGVDDVHQARVEANGLEDWAPHIVLLGQLPTGGQLESLEKMITLMPRLGIAAVSNGDAIAAGAVINIQDTKNADYRSGGELPPLPFAPQILAGIELERARRLFTVTYEDSHPALDDLDEHTATPDAEPLAATVDQSATVPTIENPADAEAADTDAEATYDTEAPAHAEAAPEASAPTEEAPQDHEADTEPPAAATDGPAPAETETATAAVIEVAEQVPDWPAPYLQLLGPIGALNLPETIPGRTIELLAFLHLNGPAVSGEVAHHGMWPDKFDPKNRNLIQLAKNVRSAIGHDPYGNLLLPEGRKGVGFTLHPMIRTDWSEFQSLVGTDLKVTPTDALVSAIRLVRGQPFAGATARKGWWVWRPPFEEAMLAGIKDAADELVTRALKIGDIDQARFGARIVQTTDPLNEAGWRMEMLSALRAGDVDAFNRAVSDMYDRIGDVEPDDATLQLIASAPAQLPGLG